MRQCKTCIYYNTAIGTPPGGEKLRTFGFCTMKFSVAPDGAVTFREAKETDHCKRHDAGDQEQ